MTSNSAEKQRIMVFAVNIFLPLLLGIILYLWIKPSARCSLVLYRILHLEQFRPFEENDAPFGGYFVKHQLCDMLFAYSLTFALLFLFRKEKHGCIVACAVAVLFETLLEIAQLWRFPGNFDVWDIIAEITITAAILLFTISKMHKGEKRRR